MSSDKLEQSASRAEAARLRWRSKPDGPKTESFRKNTEKLQKIITESYEDNKKLKEENEKLKKDGQFAEARRQSFIEARKEAKDWTDGNIKWRDEEIQKLKEDNEGLLKIIETLENANTKNQTLKDEYPETMYNYSKISYISIQMTGGGEQAYWYHLYEDDSLYIRKSGCEEEIMENKMLVCNINGDPDNVKVVSTDYECKNYEIVIEYENLSIDDKE